MSSIQVIVLAIFCISAVPARLLQQRTFSSGTRCIGNYECLDASHFCGSPLGYVGSFVFGTHCYPKKTAGSFCNQDNMCFSDSCVAGMFNLGFCA